MLTAAIAVTMIRLKERRVDLEPHSTTQATPTDWVCHNVNYI